MREIDIVVTYLDENKGNWRKDSSLRKEYEIIKGIQNKENRQAFGEERIRNWNTLRYWLRGVEKNCDWVRNVIIVVYDKNQVPEWVNQENSRLIIVEHKDYIEKDILPCYNAIEIKFYLCKIDRLSDKYVVSDDDYYFINKTDKSMFFRGNKTVQIDSTLPYREFGDNYLKASDGVFYQMLNNNFRFEKRYMGENKVKYWISHLPEARDKLFEQRMIEENKELFKEPFKRSRFRHKDQYTSDIFPDILRITGNCVLSKEFKEKCKYVTLKSDVDFNQYKDCCIVCFNDTEQLDNFYATQKKLLEFLESKLPEKCSFEK